MGILLGDVLLASGLVVPPFALLLALPVALLALLPLAPLPKPLLLVDRSRWRPALVVSVALLSNFLFLVDRSRWRRSLLVSLALLALIGGVLRYQQARLALASDGLGAYRGAGTISLTGIIDREPEFSAGGQRLYLSATRIVGGAPSGPVSGDVLLYVSERPAYAYGDEVNATGRLEAPQPVNGFDYASYLARQGIHSTMSYPEVRMVSTGHGAAPIRWLYAARSALSASFSRVLPEPQASLAQGIVLGLRGNIPADINQEFVTSGTAHILAVSGLNISIVTGLLIAAAAWAFGRRRFVYVWVALGGLWLYSLLAGMQPPVVRAAVMATVFLGAELFGRQRSGLPALLLAAAVMIGITPSVPWDVSFQMSFLCMLGMTLIYPPLRAWSTSFLPAPDRGGPLARFATAVVESLAMSLAAILAVWPAIAAYFGAVSLVAPIATLLCLPALAPITVAGFLAAGLGLVFLPLGVIAGWAAWLFLSYMLLVVRVFSAFPALHLGALNPAVALAYYALLGVGLWLVSRRDAIARWRSALAPFARRLKPQWVAAPLAIVALVAVLAAATQPDRDLHVSVLDVGQGDSILIRQGSRQVLVDGGQDSQPVIAALGREMPVWDRTIDLVVLTHSHADHLGGLLAVLDRYTVEQVLDPELAYDSPLVGDWQRALSAHHVPVTLARAGEQITFGSNVTITVLSPSPSLITSNPDDLDNESVVLRVAMGDVSFLLTGDIQAETEAELVSQRALPPTTVLKVAHHGSSTSSTDAFLAAVSPQVAVISVGAGNTFGLPAAGVVRRLDAALGSAGVYRTDLDGTIDLSTDGRSLWLKTQR